MARIDKKSYMIGNGVFQFSNSEELFFVDEQDVEQVLNYRWRRHPAGYPITWDGKKKKDILLHRFLSGFPKDLSVDHVNGNPSDNRRSNLRICTHSENLKNQNKRIKNTSTLFKGVRPSRNGKRWVAGIVVDYKNISLGTYDTQEGAGMAYDLAAKSYFGDFARCNFLSHGGWDNAKSNSERP